MVTTTRLDPYLAEDNVRLAGIADGDTYTTKLSKPESLFYTLQDASYTGGTANVLLHSISGRIITFTMKGYTAGTVNLTVKGRL